MTQLASVPARRTAWLWFAAVGVALIAAQRLAPPTMWKFGLYMAFDAAALAAMTIGLRRNRPQPSAPWRWLIASQVVCVLADGIYYTMQDALKLAVWPGPADLLYVARYAFLFAALFGLVRARGGGHPDRAAAIDAGVAGTAAALVAWLLWVGPSLSYPMPLLHRVVVAVYPVADIAIFTVSVRLLGGRGARPTAFWLLNGGFVFMLGGDALLGWQQSHGSYSVHNFTDALWLASLVLLAAAFLHPSIGDIARPTEPTRSRLTARTVALGLSAIVPPGVLLVRGASQRSEVIAIAAAALVMYSLVVLRLHLATTEQAKAHMAVQLSERRLADTVQQLQAATEARTRLLDGVVTAGENERMWIAAELHDGPIQALAAIGFGLDRAQRQLARREPESAAGAIDAQRAELTDVIAQLRQLMAELRPPALDHHGLAGAIRDYVSSFAAQTDLVCDTDLSETGHGLHPKVQTVVYRVVQEALTNVRRHAGATHCSVTLKAAGDDLELEVRDNGCGLDPADLHRFVAERHFGLAAMRERVEVAGGEWRVDSAPSAGTVVNARLPLTSEASAVDAA